MLGVQKYGALHGRIDFHRDIYSIIHRQCGMTLLIYFNKLFLQFKELSNVSYVL